MGYEKAKARYDDYDEVCEFVQGGRFSMPDQEPWTLAEMTRPETIGAFLAPLAAIVEGAENGESGTPDEELKALNSAIISNVTFIEKTGERDKTRFTERQFGKIVGVASRMAVPKEPAVEELEKWPDAFWHLGVGLLVAWALKEKDQGREDRREWAVHKLDEVATVIPGDPGVVMKEDDWDEFVEEAKASRARRGDWWPNPADVKKYAAPNFGKCLDFIAWLLYAGAPAESEEDKDSEKALRRLLYEKLEIMGGE